MDKFLNLLFSGAVSGGIYAVMAAGVVLTYQTSGIFNFAHGAVAFVTAYFFFQLNTGLDVPVVPAALISVLIFAPLLGLALDRILLRRLATAPVYARIVGSIGLLIALPALALWLVEALGNTRARLRAARSPRVRAAAHGAAASGRSRARCGTSTGSGSTASPSTPTRSRCSSPPRSPRSRSGWSSATRASGWRCARCVNRSDLAGLRGVNASRTSSAAWVLTMMLAGLGGILIAPLFQLADQQFTLIVLGALAAVALAGLRSIPIAFAGGLLLGVLQNLVYGYGDTILPGFLNDLAGLRAAIPFILTVILLFVIGRNRGSRGALGGGGEARWRTIATACRAWRRAAAVGRLHVPVRRVHAAVVPVGLGAGQRLRVAGHPRARDGAGDRVPVVRRGHRPRRHGEPRPGHVRHRGWLRRRVGGEPRLRHRRARSSPATARSTSPAAAIMGAVAAGGARCARSRCPCAGWACSRSRWPRSRSRSPLDLTLFQVAGRQQRPARVDLSAAAARPVRHHARSTSRSRAPR